MMLDFTTFRFTFDYDLDKSVFVLDVPMSKASAAAAWLTAADVTYDRIGAGDYVEFTLLKFSRAVYVALVTKFGDPFLVDNSEEELTRLMCD